MVSLPAGEVYCNLSIWSNNWISVLFCAANCEMKGSPSAAGSQGALLVWIYLLIEKERPVLYLLRVGRICI